MSKTWVEKLEETTEKCREKVKLFNEKINEDARNDNDDGNEQKVKLHHESDDGTSDSTMGSDLPLTKEEIEAFGLLSSDDENDDGSVQSADACDDKTKGISLRTIGPNNNRYGPEQKDERDCDFFVRRRGGQQKKQF